MRLSHSLIQLTTFHPSLTKLPPLPSLCGIMEVLTIDHCRQMAYDCSSTLQVSCRCHLLQVLSLFPLSLRWMDTLLTFLLHSVGSSCFVRALQGTIELFTDLYFLASLSCFSPSHCLSHCGDWWLQMALRYLRLNGSHSLCNWLTSLTQTPTCVCRRYEASLSQGFVMRNSCETVSVNNNIKIALFSRDNGSYTSKSCKHGSFLRSCSFTVYRRIFECKLHIASHINAVNGDVHQRMVLRWYKNGRKWVTVW